MSIVKLQVGLMGSARELQKDLNRLGNQVDTSQPSGLHYLLQETVLALRRNPQYALYGAALFPRARSGTRPRILYAHRGTLSCSVLACMAQALLHPRWAPRLGGFVWARSEREAAYLPTSCIWAAGEAELTKTRGLDNAEAKFNQASLNERGKFERETLSNVGGRTTRSVAKVSGDGENELIVVTVIAAVDGKVQPTELHDQQGLRENLDLLGSVPTDRLLALEVLWTPQDDNDYFTKDELVTDYPTLNML